MCPLGTGTQKALKGSYLQSLLGPRRETGWHRVLATAAAHASTSHGHSSSQPLRGNRNALHGGSCPTLNQPPWGVAGHCRTGPWMRSAASGYSHVLRPSIARHCRTGPGTPNTASGYSHAWRPSDDARGSDLSRALPAALCPPGEPWVQPSPRGSQRGKAHFQHRMQPGCWGQVWL